MSNVPGAASTPLKNLVEEFEETTSPDSSRVLVIEDDEQLRALLGELLTGEGYETATVRTGEEGLQALQRELFDVVLLDINLPGMHGINVLTASPNTQTDAAFIMMTAFAEIETAVEAMKLGAFDFLTKPLDPDQLLLIIQRAIERTNLRREVARLRRELPRGPRARVVGRSKALERLFDLIERVAPTRSTVLISGETGTGKELVARAVHDLSPRARGTFIPINCSALPESLLESELFGHMKGSFTGAIANRRGLFEEAHNGTLFLDEASTITPPVQIKLLRVLQERKIQRVGGPREISVDFRLIAATNQELTKEVAEGRFREDLYFRLNVFPLIVPPLRDRKDDIPLLAEHFRRRWAESNDMEPPAISPETLQRMLDYTWPGNVRELENFVERAMIMYSGSPTIRFDPPQAATTNPQQSILTRARDERWTVERLEREHILTVLESVSGNQTRAAAELGIDRRTLYRKLKLYRAED